MGGFEETEVMHVPLIQKRDLRRESMTEAIRQKI